MVRSQPDSIRCQAQCTVPAHSFISAVLAPNCPVHWWQLRTSCLSPCSVVPSLYLEMQWACLVWDFGAQGKGRDV